MAVNTGVTSTHLGEWVQVASEDIAEPITVREALSGPHAEQWHKAMQQEINSLHKHDVWTLTELPEGRKVIGSKWVFKVKHNADGSAEKRKARLVAEGCHILRTRYTRTQVNCHVF